MVLWLLSPVHHFMVLLGLSIVCEPLDVWRLQEVVAQFTHTVPLVSVIGPLGILASIVDDGWIVYLLVVLCLMVWAWMGLVVVPILVVCLSMRLLHLVCLLLLVFVVPVLMVLVLVSLQILHLELRLD